VGITTANVNKEQCPSTKLTKNNGFDSDLHINYKRKKFKRKMKLQKYRKK